MPTGLIRRGASYSLRRRIPLELLPAYGGKIEIVRALGTKDREEAKRLHALAWVALDQEFAAARQLRAADPDAHIREKLRQIAEARARSPSPPATITDDELEYVLAKMADDCAEELKEEVQYERREFDRQKLLAVLNVTGEGVLTDEQMALRDILVDAQAAVAAAQRHAAQATDKVQQVRPPEAEAKPTPKAALPVAGELSMLALVEQWASARQPELRTVRAHTAVARWFLERCGSLPVQRITKADVRTFIQKLDEEGVSPANAKVKLSRLRTLLSYATDRDIIAANPAVGVRIEYKQRAADKRQGFTREQLALLFSGPVHNEGARPSGGGGEAAYWLPLLALYSGARQTELGQLHPEDVYQELYEGADDMEQSAWVMRFADNPDRNQKVKTEGSERRIPIHPDLIKLGFLEVAARAKTQKRDRIFHEINPTIDGELMGNWSKWFGRYRRSLGVTGRNTPFHSFRHSFKHHARESLIDKAVNDAITGHESGDVADKYGALNYPLRPLVEGMARYRVPGFKLPPSP